MDLRKKRVSRQAQSVLHFKAIFRSIEQLRVPNNGKWFTVDLNPSKFADLSARVVHNFFSFTSLTYGWAVVIAQCSNFGLKYSERSFFLRGVSWNSTPFATGRFPSDVYHRNSLTISEPNTQKMCWIQRRTYVNKYFFSWCLFCIWPLMHAR